MRNIFLPFLTSVLTLSFLVFVSCAHQSPNPDEASAESSEEGGPQDIAEASGEESPEATPADENASDADTAAVPTENNSPDDLLAQADTPPADTTAAAPTENPPASSGDDILNELESTPPAETTAQAEPVQPVEAMPPTETAPTESIETAPSQAAAVSSRLPHIPRMAIHKKGASLNRFYFVRASDSPEMVANLLMGSSSKVSLLRKWNPGAWKAGRVVYYPSSSDPSDRRMQSFYQERNVPAQTYKIGRGDWLSKIAAKNFGSPRSWKEIAVLNGIRNPDAIEKGQEISLMPADLTGYSGTTQFTQKTDLPQEPPSISAEAVTQPPPVDKVIEPPPVEPAAEGTPPAAETHAKKEHSLDIASLVEQNLIFIATGAAIILLLVALIAVKKKKSRAAAEEFDEPVARRK